MVLLIVATWAVLALSLLGKELSVREAALTAFTAVSAIVLLLTELLSWPALLSSASLAVAWASILVGLAIVLRAPASAGLRRLRAPLSGRLAALDWLFAAVAAFFVAGTFASALLYPVTNWDSLTYHMPRIFFWLQNQSVEAYPTPEGRQLFSSVFVEYFIVQLKALSGGSDRFVNTVQWLSLVFSVVTVSLVARLLGATRRGQQVAAIVALTVPMALVQATTTQNDLTAALWSLATVYFSTRYILEPPPSTRGKVALGAVIGTSLALAVHSKPTAYLFCLPFLVWLAVAALSRKQRKGTLAAAVVALACFLALGAPVYARNARLLGGDFLALDSPDNTRTVLADRSFSSVAANGLKNGSMLLGTPMGSVNRVVERGVLGLVSLLGAPAESPEVTALGWGPYALPRESSHHDRAPAPLTVLLVAVSVVAIGLRSSRSSPGVIPYLACAMAALSLTAGLILWQPWINRLLLGTVLLAAPLVGVALQTLERRRLTRVAFSGLVAMAVLFAVVIALFNSTNRLLSAEIIPGNPFGKNFGYWNTSYDDLRFRPVAEEFEGPFMTIAEVVEEEGIENVGIDAQVGDLRIYPLLSLLADREVRYVGTTLPTDTIPAQSFTPEAIVEIVSADEYDRAEGEGREWLMAPRVAGDVAVSLYAKPTRR